MTTKNRFVWADDISRPNEVMNFNRIDFPSSCALGAASWLTDASSSCDSLLVILRLVYELVISKLHGYRIWLLIGTTAWQPDSRIVRRKKLWGGLKARGIEISHVADQVEVMFEADGKLKFFGAAQISELSLTSVAKAILEERCTYFVALPENSAIRDLVAIGWSGKLQDDMNILVYIHRTGGVIVSKVGEFDDVERGVVAVSKRSVLEKLIN